MQSMSESFFLKNKIHSLKDLALQKLLNLKQFKFKRSCKSVAFPYTLYQASFNGNIVQSHVPLSEVASGHLHNPDA